MKTFIPIALLYYSMEAETLAAEIESFSHVTDVDLRASTDLMFVDMKFCNKEVTDLLQDSHDWMVTVPSEDADSLVSEARVRLVAKL